MQKYEKPPTKNLEVNELELRELDPSQQYVYAFFLLYHFGDEYEDKYV